ncbi:lipolytic protein G-D-S-L family [Alicyclobacillus hesperidum URH17-3-68]|nr:lipolytic protein G-D-S-L family [Alicyclobacillus hesperidum URH17-3-68]
MKAAKTLNTNPAIARKRKMNLHAESVKITPPSSGETSGDRPPMIAVSA